MIVPTTESHAFVAAQDAAYRACVADGCRNAEELAADAALKVIGDPEAAAEIGARAGFKARVETAGHRL